MTLPTIQQKWWTRSVRYFALRLSARVTSIETGRIERFPLALALSSTADFPSIGKSISVCPSARFRPRLAAGAGAIASGGSKTTSPLLDDARIMRSSSASGRGGRSTRRSRPGACRPRFYPRDASGQRQDRLV